MLASSPHVAASAIKDPHFFDQNYDRGTVWYESLFDYNEETMWTLDVSHDYIVSDVAEQRLSAHLDGNKRRLLIGVRDPIDRAHSAWRFMKSQGRLAQKVSFGDSLKETSELLDHGDYGLLLERWKQHAGDIDLLDFNILVSAPELLLESICKSLGVERETISADPTSIVNPARSARSPRAVKYSRRIFRTARRLGAARSVQSMKENGLLNSLLFSPHAQTASEEDLHDQRERYSRRILSSLTRANDFKPSPIWETLTKSYQHT